jgi:hypothetical protein
MSAISTQLSLFDVPETKNKPSLEDALNCLNSIPNINRGGCGISALAIYRWCKKNGIEVGDRPFVIIDDDEYGLRYNETACANGEFADLYVPHIVIELNGQLVDSDGTGEQSALISTLTYRQTYQLNEDELLERINTDRWNDMFNRTKYLDIIAYGLDIDLDDVELF